MSQDDAPGRWTPSPLVYASAAVHLGAAAAVLARPRAWPWALGALAVNHIALAAAGLWPRSQLLGPNWTRLPGGSTDALYNYQIKVLIENTNKKRILLSEKCLKISKKD